VAGMSSLATLPLRQAVPVPKPPIVTTLVSILVHSKALRLPQRTQAPSGNGGSSGLRRMSP
jgi:hypothetical protein